MKFSVIIPVREINDYIHESIPHISKQNYKNFEILIFSDIASKEKFLKTKIIETGKIGPAEKRDLALKYAKGEILAFLDDDAYPKKEWLKSAIKHFKNKDIGAVCGPAVTPKSDSFLQKISGDIYASRATSGNVVYRHVPFDKVFEVDDYPSVNLLVRKSLFKKIGGFDSNFYPGEDTKLCLDIVYKEKKKIIYDPEVFVWHHRRPFGLKHFKQVWNYSNHRGYFVKKFPKTSLRFSYFVPSLFLIGLILGLIFWQNEISRKIYLWVLVFYISFLVALELFKKRNPLRSLVVIFGIFLTHLVYGMGFIWGLCMRKMMR